MKDKIKKWTKHEHLLFAVVEYIDGGFWTDRRFSNLLHLRYGLTKSDAKFFVRILSQHKEKSK